MSKTETRGLDVLNDVIAFVSTYAELKAACEDSAIRAVYMVADCIGGDAIVSTSKKYIDGLGHTLDWNGASNGFMFYNNSANYGVLKNISWVRTGNSYNPFSLASHWYLINCISVDTGYPMNFGGNCHVVACNLGCRLNFTGSDGSIIGGEYSHIYLYNTPRAHVLGATFNGEIRVYGHSAYTVNREVVIEASHFLWASRGIYIARSNDSVIACIKIIGNTFDGPPNAIYVSDSAGFTVTDVDVINNTFIGSTNAFNIGVNTLIARWRFANNKYPGVATRYNFIDPGDFIYTNDGDGVDRRHNIPHQATIAASEPFPPVGCCMTWEDTTNNKVYWKFNDPVQGNKKVELT